MFLFVPLPTVCSYIHFKKCKIKNHITFLPLLLSFTVIFRSVHEIIRVMNVCHYLLCTLQIIVCSNYNYLVIVGVEAVAILSKRVREANIQTWLKVEKEAWPPELPKVFTPLVFIQHQSHHKLRQSIKRGHIDKADTLPKRPRLDSRETLQDMLEVTKEILAPLETSDDPQFILIEGAPGIGKSLLLSHLSYCWSKHQILQKFKLVLLVCLRNPAVQQMSFVKDLLQLFCKRDEDATEVVSVCRDYFVNNNGEDLALLLDGYDEFPKRLRKHSLIADILKRRVLHRCTLIVSSRPHASVKLLKKATLRVDILGFTEAEQEHYIKESMKDQPQKIDELTQYLQGHSTISSLCCVPFNLVVLAYLYKQGFTLPENPAELYNCFICLTVCQHLAKHGHHLQGNITELADLPEPYNKIIQQLSKLSLEALNVDKSIFTFEEIKEVCPDITAVPGAINGCGLLQAVEHFGFTRTTTTMNFLHFSIQEYLAAHHIANLPADEELKIIEQKFWSDIHFNMFSIYVSLTKGQRPSFKHFLCGGNNAIIISEKFLNKQFQLQRLRLYRWFYEAGDVDICKAIEQSVKFRDKIITLAAFTLTAIDVECVTVFLTSSSHKEWVWLDMSGCYIRDHGLHILHRGLLHCRNVTIDQLGLHYNGLTVQSSSMISDITVKCKVKELWIAGNRIGEDERLYSMLSNPTTMLVVLNMYNTQLSSRAVIALLTAMKDNNKLKSLDIGGNSITDDARDAITAALERNSCLKIKYS